MSAKTVAEKLRIAPGTAVWSSHRERLALLGPLPDGVAVVERAAEARTAFLFADDAASLRALVAAHAGEIAEPQVLWVAYPKGNRTDVNRDTVWPVLAEAGLRPIGQASLDDVWSVMRFRPDRPGEEPFRGGAKS